MFEGFVEIGKITGTFGTKGQVRIAFYTDNLDRFKAGKKIRVRFKKIGYYVYEIESTARVSVNGAVIKLKGISSVTEAEDLVGKSVVILESEREPTGDDEIYPDELIGFTASYEETKVGQVIEAYDMGAYGILEIQKPDGSTFYLPFLKKFIQQLDKQKHTLGLTKEGFELANL